MLNVKVITERYSSVPEEVFIKYILASSNKLFVIFVCYINITHIAIVIFMLLFKVLMFENFVTMY